MGAYTDTFEDLPLEGVHDLARARHEAGQRFVNMHAATEADGTFTLFYSYTGDEVVCDNYRVHVTGDDTVPSISDEFLAAFFFENEVHDLFGIRIEGIAIDFGGNFYQVSLESPMARVTEEGDMYAVNREYSSFDPVRDSEGGTSGPSGATEGGE